MKGALSYDLLSPLTISPVDSTVVGLARPWILVERKEFLGWSWTELVRKYQEFPASCVESRDGNPMMATESWPGWEVHPANACMHYISKKKKNACMPFLFHSGVWCHFQQVLPPLTRPLCLALIDRRQVANPLPEHETDGRRRCRCQKAHETASRKEKRRHAGPNNAQGVGVAFRVHQTGGNWSGLGRYQTGTNLKFKFKFKKNKKF